MPLASIPQTSMVQEKNLKSLNCFRLRVEPTFTTKYQINIKIKNMRLFTIVYKKEEGYDTQTIEAKNIIEAIFRIRFEADMGDISSINSYEVPAVEKQPILAHQVATGMAPSTSLKGC